MSNLKYLFSKKYDETYSINWYDGPQTIETSGVKFVSEPIKGLVDIKTFTDDTYDESSTLYFRKYLKYKYDNVWSDMIPIEEIIESGLTFSCLNVNNTQNIIDPNKELIIEIYYLITDDSGTNTISLSVDNIQILGEYVLNVTDESALLENVNDEVILTSKDIYKIFSLDDFILVSNHDNAEIHYRFSQDNNRTFTDWLPLTKENIASTKLSPLRFATVEYLIKNLGQPLAVYDIILIGDFQNVSANYLKTNKYGLKQDCISGENLDGSTINNTGSPGSSTSNGSFVSSCSSYSTNAANEVDEKNASKSGSYWNPYDHTKITNFSNMLGNQVTEIFGWDIDYYLSEPDFNGIDYYIHEYTLKNIIDKKSMKIIVPENKFPIESVIINQFNLDLFDTFEIHIMKDEFKNKFGINRRPAEDDILYICVANMLYYIKHAQAFKDVMNAATYYKIILEKYEYKTNIRFTDEESKNSVDGLSDNTTIESLFGGEMEKEEDKIANKIQFKPTTMDYIRQKIHKDIIYENENLFIEDFDPVKSAYNFSNIRHNSIAIDYKKSDSLIKSDNRSFIFWFKFNNDYDLETGRISNKILKTYAVPDNKEMTFLDNYDKVNKLGYKISYFSNQFHFYINNKKHSMKTQLLSNIWYIAHINLDQQKQLLDMNIYKRTGNINNVFVHPISYQRELVYEADESTKHELISQGYKPISNLQDVTNNDIRLVKTESFNIEPVNFDIKNNLKLIASNIKLTNIRIFDTTFGEEPFKNIVKENIVKNEQYLILADNATKKIVATNYYNKNWK